MFGLLFFLGAGELARVYGEPRLVSLTQWLAILPIAVGFTAQFRAQLMSDLRFVTLEATTVATRAAGSVAAIAVAALTGQLYALLILAIIPKLLQIPILVVASRWRPGLPGDWRGTLTTMTTGVHIFGMNLMRNVSRSLIVPVLGLTVPAASVGQYDRAYQLTATPTNALMDSLQRVMVPTLAKMRGEAARLEAAFRRASNATLLTLCTAIWFVAAIGEPLVLLLLGDAWQTAAAITQVLAFGAGFRLLGMTEQWMFIANGSTRAGLIFSVWTQPAIVAVSLLGLPMGVFGVAALNTLAWIAYWPIAVLAVARATRVPSARRLRRQVELVFSFALPIAISAAVPRLVFAEPALQLTAGFVAAAATLAALMALRPAIRSELFSILGLAISSLRRR